MWAGLRLPYLSEPDPELAGEGSLDPLGLAAVADRLAESIAPGVRARMFRIRFVTGIAITAALIEDFADAVSTDGVTPAYLALEWIVAEALARARGLPETALRRVPGIEKARAIVRRETHLDSRAYLKNPQVFGFHGVYKPLALALGVVDKDLVLTTLGQRLLTLWEAEQGLEGFVERRRGTEGGELSSSLREAVKATLQAGQVLLPVGSRLWPKVVEAFRPDGAGRREKALLSERLEAEEEPLRRELVRWLAKLTLPDSELEKVEVIRAHASPELRLRLGAVEAYERVANLLQTAFDLILRHSYVQGMKPVKRHSLENHPDMIAIVEELPGAVRRAQEALELMGELAVAFENHLSSFGEVTSGAQLFDQLLAHHDKVQKAKPPNGKRPWLDEAGEGFMVRSLYGPREEVVLTPRFLHPFRLVALENFLEDLQ